MRRSVTGLAAALAALLPVAAGASPFPTRQGEVGLLDVPTAETAGPGGGLAGAELRLDKMSGHPASGGPLPLSLVFGLSERLDGGVAMREGGQPGDATPAPLVFAGAAKFRIATASGLWPALAASLTLDSINAGGGRLGGRLVASTADLGRVRFAVFGGAEGHGPRPLAIGPTGGLAISLLHRSDLETVLEATTSPRGALVGGAFRWMVSPKVGVSLGLSWLPKDGGFRVSLGFGLAAAPARRVRPAVTAPEPVAAAPERAKAPAGPLFLDDRPRFRMRIASGASQSGEPRHLQYGPFSDAARLSPSARPARIERADPEALRLSELQVAGEALEGRARRLTSAEGALASRQDRIAGETGRLDRLEKELASEAEVLEARDRQLKAPGKPAELEIALADTEEKLRAAESQSAALEASLREDGRRAAARERDLSGRERQLAPEAEAAQRRLDGAPGSAEARAAAVEARRTSLEATEARLSAARDRLDVAEKMLEARSSRLEYTRRRLNAKEERLASVQKRAAARTPAARSAEPAAPAPAAKLPVPAPRPEPSGAGGQAMLAATVIQLPVAGRPLAPKDKEAVAEMAHLAAQEKVELLVWARAQNPGLLEAAALRADEVKALAVAAGLPPSQVATRVTLRPSTAGIDVVVSPVRGPAPAGGTR